MRYRAAAVVCTGLGMNDEAVCSPPVLADRAGPRELAGVAGHYVRHHPLSFRFVGGRKGAE